ncbi:hypothetical protein [Nitrosopumilus adriaticus]|uniref:hypothetical protein n=1 Tax=Nitrosopumilus adriaticus TaxID=1580092 RepID=UPI00352D6D39
MKRIFLFVLIFFAVTGFFTSPLSFAQSTDDPEKERLQLEKERRIYDETYQNLQQQIHSLTTTLSQLLSSGVDDDKLEDLEGQLEELYDDLSDLEKTEPDLIEREKIFKKNNIPQNISAETTDSEPTSIPPWFKSNAKWWKEGLISDGDIINALESLIIQDVIPLEKFVKESAGIEHTAGVQRGGDLAIPTYQKDVFGFWSDGLVSDDEIVNSIGHLMSQGIINSAKIQGEIAERQAKFDQKMAELDASLDSDSKFMDNIDGGDGSTTVINPDGSKTVTFEDETSTTFFPDGSRVTHYPKGFDFNEHDDRMPTNPFHFGTAHTDTVTVISKLVTNSDGTISIWELSDTASYQRLSELSFHDSIMRDGLIIQSVIPDLSYDDDLPETSGGMQQLTQVTALVIDGIHFPISQFTIWKWTGECDDAWHYHTPTSQAIAVDGITGIIDPDQENCGFGKVGEVQLGTTFMSQDQIRTFRDRADADPLSNEPMMGGSDDESAPDNETTPVDVNSGPVSVEESDSSTNDDSSKSVFPLTTDDWDGDGIPDNLDDQPYLVSTKFGTNGEGLPGEIIDTGDLEIKILYTEGFGALSIEVTDDGYFFNEYDDGKAPFVIIDVMGVELELEPGIYEFTFG